MWKGDLCKEATMLSPPAGKWTTVNKAAAERREQNEHFRQTPPRPAEMGGDGDGVVALGDRGLGLQPWPGRHSAPGSKKNDASSLSPACPQLLREVAGCFGHARRCGGQNKRKVSQTRAKLQSGHYLQRRRGNRRWPTNDSGETLFLFLIFGDSMLWRAGLSA